MPQYRNSERVAVAKSGGSQGKSKASVFVGLAMAAVLLVGGTVAFLMTSTSEVKNTFDPAQVSCRVDETIDGATKRDVKVTNTSDINAYIRTAVVVNWADEAGNVSGTPVKSSDYAMEYGSGWVEGADGFWYWTKPVAAGQSTGYLIESCIQVGTAPEGDYVLSVDILASAIQALPSDVVAEEWNSGVSGVNKSTGALTIKTPKDN